MVGYDLQINNIKVEKQWTGKMQGAFMSVTRVTVTRVTLCPVK